MFVEPNPDRVDPVHDEAEKERDVDDGGLLRSGSAHAAGISGGAQPGKSTNCCLISRIHRKI